MQTTKLDLFIVYYDGARNGRAGYFADKGNYKEINPEIDQYTHYYPTEKMAWQAAKLRNQWVYFNDEGRRDDDMGNKFIEEHFKVIPVKVTVEERK